MTASNGQRMFRAASITTILMIATCGVDAATAADMPSSQPYTKVATSSAYDWSGFYLGGMAGGIGEKNDVTTPGGEVLTPLRNYTAHFMGGGYAGFNAQFSSLVVGVEGDVAGFLGGKSVSSSERTFVPGIFASSASNPKWLATVSGRLGLAINNWLVYGKGGGAWMSGDYTGNVETGAGALLATQTLSATRSGWLAGAGVEYAWNPNWLSRLEYNYIDFGTKRLAYTLAGINNVDYRGADHVVKAGIAYKFGGMTGSRY